MPLYDYRNKKTGQVEEHFVKISDREQFLAEHPDLEPMVSAAAVGNRFITLSSPSMKPPSDYTSLLKRMKRNNKGSTINIR